MFRRYQYYYDYNLQQNRLNQLNMGNPYFPGSPYADFSSQYTPSNYQQQMFHAPYYQPINGGWNYLQTPYQATNASPFLAGKNSVQSIFQNPLEPKNPYHHQMQMTNQPMNYNPYPKTNTVPRPNAGLGTIMNSFKGQDGNFDLNKMVNTAGQMMNAVSQVSAMVKGIGGFFKV